MMPRLGVLIGAALLGAPAIAGNYQLIIDGTAYEVDAGAEQAISLPDGRQLKVRLDVKDVLTFRGDSFSFEHPGSVTPQRKPLSDGVTQTIMVTANGATVIVQDYSSIDPSMLVDLMMSELLKEETDYGYKIATAVTTKRLADGRTMTGKTAVSSYKTTEYTRTVHALKGRDSGLLVVSIAEKSNPPEDFALIDLFWRTLAVSSN